MKLVFFVKIHVKVLTKVFYIQIWFICETQLFFFSNKNHGVQNKPLYRKRGFFAVDSENYWITNCKHMTSHAIWADEITDVMISLKKDQ